MNYKRFRALLLVLGLSGSSYLFAAEPANSSDQKIAELEKLVKQLMVDIQTLKQQTPAPAAGNVAVANQESVVGEDKPTPKVAATTPALTDQELANLKQMAQEYENNDLSFEDQEAWYKRLTLGGYGEMHYNFAEGSAKDKSDVHRLVLAADYQFNDWLNFITEVEVEHGYVRDNNGYVIVEQAYANALVADDLELRIGRMLTPLGYVNQNHEPTTFNSVERPTFYKTIIPTTWSVDGAGLAQTINPYLEYQAYVVSGLDGSKFDYTGIRNGRIQEEPSMQSPAVTGRTDLRPFGDKALPYDQKLRLGASTFAGGIDNVNRGGGNGLNGDIIVGALDYEYNIGRFDFIGAVATTSISDAEEMKAKNVAEEMLGYYQEIGFHLMPDSWKNGKLVDSDIVIFARYDWGDTQYDMPSGQTANGAGQYQEYTMGVKFLVTPQLALKADYQIREDETDNDLPDLINLGLALTF